MKKDEVRKERSRLHVNGDLFSKTMKRRLTMLTMLNIWK